MKALRFDRTGSLDALRVVEMETPVPGEDEALVRVRGAGMNPSDVKNVLGRLHETAVLRTPGRDFSGVVEIGPEEWNGREVWGTGSELGFTHDGSHAEYILVPVSGLTLKPISLSFPLAASCGVPAQLRGTRYVAAASWSKTAAWSSSASVPSEALRSRSRRC